MAQAVPTRGPVTGTATAGKKRRKLFLLDLYSTAVGKKYVMAITGIALMGFVLAHMIGNLKMYLGPEQINHYGEFLRELLVPAPAAHAWRCGCCASVCIGAVLLHIHAAYSLTILNREARSVKYQSPRDYQVANFASRTMRWTGIIVALFVALPPRRPHVGLGQPRLRDRGDVYGNVDASAVAGAGRDPLHRRQHRARHPPVPRRLEPVPVDGVEQPTVQQVAAGLRRSASPR